jgi:hypothetical protein
LKADKPVLDYIDFANLHGKARGMEVWEFPFPVIAFNVPFFEKLVDACEKSNVDFVRNNIVEPFFLRVAGDMCGWVKYIDNLLEHIPCV